MNKGIIMFLPGFLLALVLSYSLASFGQEGIPAKHIVATDAILLTVVLKHDQSMNVNQIQEIQEKQGFYKSFPPEGTSVVNWFVMMGLGQVVVLEVPASKLRDVNLAIEKTAWRAFRSEFYPTYDLYPVIKDKLKNKSKVSL